MAAQAVIPSFGASQESENPVLSGENAVFNNVKNGSVL
jgi:hypothetical protein